MSKLAARRMLDFLICCGATGALYVSGGWWAVGIGLLFAGWNYYDGMTRGDLSS